MTDDLPEKEGAVCPLEYDWKWQFGWIDPADGVTPFDTSKVYGLALYAKDLETRVEELEKQLTAKQNDDTLKMKIFKWASAKWTELA